MEVKNMEFKTFLDLWNTQQGQKTPELHFKMADWLAQQWVDGKTRILLMAFRSAGKSTIVGVFAAWLLYRKPDLRILVLSADYALARKMVRNVKRIVESHAATQSMRPVKSDQWASDSFTVQRNLELRDPSMLARGILSNITGSRADIVICDDVEVPNTCATAEKREELRNRLHEIAYVLVAGGCQLYVGTPHTYYSIYADLPRLDIGEEEPFLVDFERMKIPIVDEKGCSVWPERYDFKEIESIKRQTGPNKFDSQMMLQPINILDSRLDVELLQYYNEEIVYDVFEKKYYLGHHLLHRMNGFWDPSTASRKGDDSVVAVGLMDLGGNFYLHHMEYIKLDPNKQDETEMQQQCRIAAEVAKKYSLKAMGIENNGLARYFPDELRTQMNKISPKTSVMPHFHHRPKEQRIIESFDGLLAAGRLFVHERVKQTPFIREMREWKPRGRCKDDGLDAAAAVLLELPMHSKDPLSGRGVKAVTVLD